MLNRGNSGLFFSSSYKNILLITFLQNIFVANYTYGIKVDACLGPIKILQLEVGQKLV